MDQSLYSKLPRKPGVYFFKNTRGEIIYIGKAIDLKARVSSYFVNKIPLGSKTNLLVSEIRTIDYQVVESEVEALLLEAELIRNNQPRYNVDWKDGKGYPLIKITLKDKYPSVLTVRREDDPHAVYFGPFPNTTAMRSVLRFARKIFPFVSVKNHGDKICFFHHLSLCPCPQAFDSPETKITYQKNIKNLILFLSGRKKSLLRNFNHEMNLKVKDKNFEAAQLIKNQIAAISQITQQSRQPKEYLANPNLLSDLREDEVDKLSALLKVKLNLDETYRTNSVEAYDISNISGKNAVGSMVRFEKGDPDKSLYRRFKIKTIDTPSDTGMMREVIIRRLSHKDWPYPDLFVVDGGIPQTSVIYHLFSEMGIKIPLIGLAKRLEEIVIPKTANGDLSFITLNIDGSSGQNLLKRIRDEAHRFAQSYYHKLSLKSLTDKINY